MLNEQEIARIENAANISLPLCMRWRLSAEIKSYVRESLAIQKGDEGSAVLKRMTSTIGSLVNDLNNYPSRQILFWQSQCDSRRLLTDLQNLQKCAAELRSEHARPGRPANPLFPIFIGDLSSIYVKTCGRSTAVLQAPDGYRKTDGFINFAMAVFNTMPEALRPSSSMALASHWERVRSKAKRLQNPPVGA
jgi:hypothetical protein